MYYGMLLIFLPHQITTKMGKENKNDLCLEIIFIFSTLFSLIVDKYRDNKLNKGLKRYN